MKIRSLCAAAIPVLCLQSALASADISYAQKISVEAAGGMSLFASDGTVLTQISGDRSRTESTIEMKSKLVGMMAGNGNTANIVRLDRSLTWNLLPDKQQYSEVTFAEARAQMQQASEAMKNAGSGDTSSGLPVAEENCEWTEADLEVEHPSGKEKIAGIKTNRHIIRLRQSCREPESGKVCDITWLMETWLAKKVPAEQEARQFQRQYAESMGMDDLGRQVQGPGQGLLEMFTGNWEAVAEEFRKMEGYPLKTVLQMGLGGEQCTTASGNPIAMDDMWSDASTAAYNAALDQAGYQAGSAAARTTGEAFGESIGGSIGGAAVGAAAGELIGGLTGMFRKKESTEPAPQAQPAPAGQQVTVFRISTEVTNWSEIDIPAERFEEPVGWKKL